MANESTETGERSDSAALAAGSLVNGIAAYLYVVLGTQILGAAAFAPISILWTIWSFAAATLTFPIQHWIIRTLRTDHGERAIRDATPTLVMAGTIAATATLGAGFVWREQLFSSPGLGYPALAAVIVLSAAVLGFARGLTAGRGQFKAAAAIVAGENLLRLAVGCGVLLLAGGPLAYSSALAAGLGILVFFPRSLRASNTGRPTRSPAGRMLAGIAGGTLIAQIVLTGPPILLAVLGGRPETITALFTTASVARAPYLIALGLAIRGNARLSSIAAAHPGRLKRATQIIVLASIASTLVAAALGGWIGPPVIEMVFGEGTALATGPTALVVGASVLALGNLALMMVLIARGHTTRITASWVAAGLGSLMVVAVMQTVPLDRVTAGFVVAEAAAFAALTLAAFLRTDAA